jgi:hypothetical protein
MLSGYVYVDMAGRDIGGYVEDLKRVVRDKVALPPGYTIAWSGQYEFMQRVRERLKIFVPLTIAIIFVLFYFTFRSVAETLMVMLGVPFALIGGVWYLVFLESHAARSWSTDSAVSRRRLPASTPRMSSRRSCAWPRAPIRRRRRARRSSRRCSSVSGRFPASSRPARR